MLSIIDLKRELGKNIYIYPLHIESIKSNSIDLHVSQFAWSLSTRQSISKDGYIIIPPHDTALIYSEESIYVSNRIGGSYHSKVTLVSKGASHIGTTLDAQYVGCSLVAINNLGDKKLPLRIGSEFVTIQFWYLHSPDYEDAPSHDNEPGHPRMLSDFSRFDKYIEWRDANPWTTRKKELYDQMTTSAEYDECKSLFKKELREFSRVSRRKNFLRRFCMILCIAAVFITVTVVSYISDMGHISLIMSKMAETVIYPVLVAVLTSYLIVDHRRNNE